LKGIKIIKTTLLKRSSFLLFLFTIKKCPEIMIAFGVNKTNKLEKQRELEKEVWRKKAIDEKKI
jgi:cAMP phosphodiesterase